MFRLALPRPGSNTIDREFCIIQRRHSSCPRQRLSVAAAATRARRRRNAGIDDANGAVVDVAVAAAASHSSSAAASRAPSDTRLSSEDFDTIDVSVVAKNTEQRDFSARNRAAGSDDVGVGVDGIDSFDASASASVVDLDLDEDDDAFAFDDDDDDERAFVLRDDFVDFDDEIADDEEEDEAASRPAAGPRCVLLAGFAEGEAAAVRALVDAAGFRSAAVLPAEGAEQLSLTVRDAILGGGVKEPDWSSPKEEEEGGNGVVAGKRGSAPSRFLLPCRAVLFGGLTPREQAAVADALEAAGIPRFAVAEAREEEWKERRVGDVLAEAAAGQGLLLPVPLPPSMSSPSSSLPKRASGGGQQRGAAAAAAAAATAVRTSSSSSSSPPPPKSPELVVDALPDVEEMIRRAEKEAGGRIKTIEMKGANAPSSSSSLTSPLTPSAAVEKGREKGAVISAAAAADEEEEEEKEKEEAPAWHAEASAAGPALLDALRDNVAAAAGSPSPSAISATAAAADDDDGDNDDTAAAATVKTTREEPELLLDAVITGASTATAEEEEATAAAAGEEEGLEGEEEKEEETASDPLSSYLAAATAADPGRLPRTNNSPTFSASERSSNGSSSKEETIGKTEKVKAEAEASSSSPSPASSSSPSSPTTTTKAPPITIAPVGLEGDEELALHDRVSQELDAKFRAMPAGDRRALRERMREEAREPTRDAIVAAVACGLSFDEIVEMARAASEAAKEAETGLGVPWGELAKADLEPSEDELRSAAAVAAAAASAKGQEE